MAWFLSPSGWPTHADSTEEAAELASRGYASLAESAVPAAVAAYQAAQGAPPPSSLPGYALAADVAAALALKANAATVGGKLNTTDLPVKMAEVQADTASAFSVQQRAASVAAVVAAPETKAVFGSVVDYMALARIEREAAAKAAASRSRSASRYADATEWTEDWAALTAWTNAGVQVSGNKLYGVSGANPSAAIRAISVPPNVPFFASTVMHYDGTAKSMYVGIDCSAPGAAPAASSPNAVTLGMVGSGGAAGKIGTFVGANATGALASASAASNVVTAGDYLFTVAGDETWLVITARKVGSSNEDYVVRAQKSLLPGLINNFFIYNADNRGLTGNSWGPVIFTSDMVNHKAKTVAGTTVVSDPYTVGTKSPAGVNWRLQVPVTYDARQPAPLVLFLHQSVTGTAASPYSETRMGNVTAALAAAGYLLASSDNGGDLWGNQTGLDDYVALVRWVQAHYATGPIFLLGASMGALFMSNLLAQRKLGGIAAAASICGVADLDVLHANATYTAAIRTAFGVASDGSDYEAKTAGFNPIDRGGAEFRGIPHRFYVASTDPTVPPASNGVALAAKLAPYSPEAAVVSVTTPTHLDPATYQGSDLVSFFGRYL